MTLSVVVVFVVSYMLILPALTLDNDKAKDQGGINVPAVEQTDDAQEAEASEASEDKASDSPKESAPSSDESDKASDDSSAKESADKATGKASEKSNNTSSESNSDGNNEKETAKSGAKSDDGKSGKTSGGKNADMLVHEGEGFNLTVDDKSSVLPSETEVAVEEITADTDEKQYKKLYSETKKAIRKDSKGKARTGFVRFYDISLLADGEEIEPDKAVNVIIDYDKKYRKDLEVTDSEDIKIIHFTQDKETGEIEPEVLDSDEIKLQIETKNEKMTQTSFDAESFSVYAVVGTESDVDTARATVNFYGKDQSTPIATVYVKNSDTEEEIEDIVFDPGCGELANKELFDGWSISTTNTTDGSSYTLESDSMTIEDIRSYLANLEIKEGDEVNIYARIVKIYNISYVGESANTLLGSSIVKVLSDNDIADYTVNLNYTPATSEQAFMGWNVSSGSSNITEAKYNNATVSEPPYLNGTKLKIKGDIVLSVNAPPGHWLVFDENGKGATYNAPQFVEDGHVTVEPASEMVRTGYSFGGWYKDADCTDGNEFTFGEELSDSITVYAKWTPVDKANYTVIIWKERMSDTYDENGGTGEGKEKNYDFADSFTFSGDAGSIANAVSNGTSSVVDGDDNGTRYNNARIRGVDSNNNSTDTTISYTGYHCADYDKNVTIAPEGNSVINVYYDRNTVKYTFYTYGSSSSGGQWMLCDPDGNVFNGQVLVSNGNGGYERFNDTPRYGDGRRYYYQTGGGNFCDPSRVYELSWEYIANTGSQWNVYQESVGLYGEDLDWPTDTSIWWYEDHDNTHGIGTRMTYKSDFLPTDDDMTVEYWGSTSSTGATIHFYTQDLDGGYTEQYMVSSGAGTFSINDKFTGFEAYQYRIDNGTWQNVGSLNVNTGIYGDPVRYATRLDIRYKRQSGTITFMDGSYFTGNGNRMNETPQAEAFRTTDPYYFEQSVASYNKGGADYYTPPEKPGYTFAGWYADDACTVEYDFTTMPVTGITVYAKWIENQYRVFLHPNVPESDTSLQWGSENQDMNFRISSGEKVSTPTGRRNEYEMIGWYLDPECTVVFNSEDFVANDTTITTPYDKSVDLTDHMNKWGNIEGVGYNTDLTGYNGGDRFWITKKLDLYAKWRAVLTGADGIGVKYDANGGTNAPTDTTHYLDNSDAVAQGAPTPPDDTQQFLYWVIQKWNGEEYEDLTGDHNKIYPGDTFTVLKENAQIVVLPESTEENPAYQYTVQLRAQYGPKDEPKPTHLTWYANGGVAADGVTTSYTDPAMQINQADPIRPADTFTREGYEFIGWARVDSTTPGYELSEKDLTEDDLFLKYDSGKFYAQITENSEEWSEVGYVAADEKDPYHDLYAVWKKKDYTVTVIKEINNGLSSDYEIPFKFSPSFEDLTSSVFTDDFYLVGQTGGADVSDDSGHVIHYDKYKEIEGVPFGTTFSITEEDNPDFAVSVKYSVSDADDESKNINNQPISNGEEISVDGNVTITVTNSRKLQKIRVKKTEPDETSPLGGAAFEVTIDGHKFDLVSDDADGLLKNTEVPDGIFNIPFGEYTLVETEAPSGYDSLNEDVIINITSAGVTATYGTGHFTVEPPSEGKDFYTVIIPNNPGVVLPHTGGEGTQKYLLIGMLLILISGSLLLIEKWIISRRCE